MYMQEELDFKDNKCKVVKAVMAELGFKDNK
ncbi:hypothetical protein JTE90_029358, partial [Oedothorax gibbosus]